MSDPATTTELAALRAELAALRAQVAELQTAFTFKEGKVESLSVDRIRCLSISFHPADEPEKCYGDIVTGEGGCYMSFLPHGTNGAQFFLRTSAKEGPKMHLTGPQGTLTLKGGALEMGPSTDERTVVLSGLNSGHLWLGDRAERPAIILGTMPWGGEIVVNFHGNTTHPTPMQAGVLMRSGRLHFAIAPEVGSDDHEERMVYLGMNGDGGGCLNLTVPGAMQAVVLSAAAGGAAVQVNGQDAPCVAAMTTGPDHSGVITLHNELGVTVVTLRALEDAGCVTTYWAGQERVRVHGAEHTGVVLTFEQSGYPNGTLPADLDPQPPA